MGNSNNTKGKTITSLLADIQRDLKAPKGQMNKFGNYRYRSCEDIVEAVKPWLNGAALTLEDDIVAIDGRVYVKATASIRMDSDAISVTAFARESLAKKGMDDAQVTGAASSYARKYALNGLFAIDDTKDADATNEHGKRPSNSHIKNDNAPHYSEDVNAALDPDMVATTVINYFDGDKASARDFVESEGFPIPSQCDADQLRGILNALKALDKAKK